MSIFVLFFSEDSCIGVTVSSYVFLLLYPSDIIEENNIDSKDAIQVEKDVMESNLSLQNPTLQGEEDSQLEISECEGAEFKDCDMTSMESIHGSAGFQFEERPTLQLGLPRALCEGKRGIGN